MLNCSVTRNSENRITKVVSQTGQESQLFINIAKHPLVNSTEDAFNIYQNIFSKELQETPEENVRLRHLVNGEQFASYGQALKAAQEGQKIEIGFSTPESFHSIIIVAKDTNISNELGFVQNGIVNDLISENKKRVGDDYYLQSAGESIEKKAVTMEVLWDMAKASLGSQSLVRSANTFTLNKTLDKTVVYNKSGEQKTETQTEIDSLSFPELKERFDNAEELIAQREWTANRPAYNNIEQLEAPLQLRTEEDLQMRLLNLLNKMGVSVVSISEYIKNYKIKNGVNPAASALADLANRVVAYAGNEISLQDLTEEVSHFIVESFPQERTENILRNIDKSEEYKEFAQAYREIYRDEVSEADLENAVRKEVLGKIVANSIASNFSAEQKTETQRNFIENALELIREFFTNIANYFKKSYRTELDSYLQDIDNIVQTGELSEMVNLSNLDRSALRLYNVSPESKLYRVTNLLLDQLQQQEKILRKNNLGSSSNLSKLKAVQDQMEDVIKSNSVAGLTAVAKARISQVRAALKDAKSKGGYLSSEEMIIFKSLTNEIEPLLNQVNILITENGYTELKNWKTQQTSINEIIKAIRETQAEFNTVDSQNVERLVQEVQQKHSLSDAQADSVRKWIIRADKDSSAFIATFGQMVHARDGMLNLAAYVMKNMTNEGDLEWFNKTKSLQTLMEKNGVTEADFAKLVDGGYIISSTDFTAFKEASDKVFLDVYRKYYKGELTDAELLESKRKRELSPLDNQSEYEQELRKEQNKLRERVYNDAYYKEYEDKIEKANLSPQTKEFLSGYSSDLADIRLKTIRVVDGKQVTDQSLLSSADRERLKEVQESRRMAKAYYDASGNLKVGLSQKKENGVNLLDENGKPIFEISENASVEARIAFDLNNLDSQNTFSTTKGTSERFLNELRKIQQTHGREEALDFLQMNAFISFKEEFWKGLSSGLTVTQKLRQVAGENEEVREIIAELEEKNLQKTNILRLFVNKNSPVEIDADRMPQESKDKIKTLQQDISALIERAKKYTKNITLEEQEDVETLEDGVSSVNDSYVKMLSDFGINETEAFLENIGNITEQLSYAKEHMTDENKKSVTKAQLAIDDYRAGKRKNLPKSVENLLEKRGQVADDLLNVVEYGRFMKQYSEDRLLPYYKRFSPLSYNSFKEQLQTSDDLAGLLSDLSEYPSLEVTPNISFFEAENVDNLNKDYNPNFNGGYIQPNKQQFKNERFYDLFGDDKGSKNPRLFEVYNAMMEYRLNSLEANDAGKGYNAYLLPQVRKGRVEKASKLFKGKTTQNLRNVFEDTFSFTDDEMVKGTQFGDSVKVIPKMYLSEIEPSDVSNELFYSLTLAAKESYARKSKIKHYGDVMSIMDTVLTRSYEGTGKAAVATQTYKMLKSSVDYTMFGIKEISSLPIKTPFGNVDISKVARVLLSYVKLRNLGLNVVIPFTSWATAKLNVWTETLIGQYFHKRSHKLGTAEYGRIWKDGMREFGKINTKAWINVLGQHFKSFSLEESYKSSNYSALFRGMNRTGYALHSMANYPIYGQNLLSILHDYRVVGNRVINFNQFNREQLLQGVSKKDIEVNWDALENQVIYKFLKPNDGALDYSGVVDGKSLADYLGKSGEELSAEINSINNTITNQVRVLNEYVDGSISNEDRTYAQRDSYLSYFFTHRGWLSIALSRRLKNRGINLETGIEEEGSYLSFANFMGSYIREYKDSGAKGVINNFKTAWNKADDVQRANIMRVSKEMAVLNSVILLAVVLKGFADDEDNADLYPLQLASYLTYRVASETASSSLAIGSNITEIIKSPIVGFQSVANLTNVMDVFDGDEVTRGKYKGFSERSKYFITTVPGFKGVYDLYDIQNTRKTYGNFNEGNFDFTVGTSFIWSDSEEE